MQGRHRRRALARSYRALKRRRRLAALALVATATAAWAAVPSRYPERPAALTGPPVGHRAAVPLAPPAGYYRPVVVDGMTFPIARSNWFSVIEFEEDWHDPRFRLIDGRWQLVGFHEGVDIVAEKGTPIVSATDGVVEAVGWTFYSGSRVGIRGADGSYYFYAHLSGYGPGIALGSPVRAGDVLGLVGNTGYGPPGHEDEFPPHLHFGIREGETWVNPYPLIVSLYERAAELTAAGERRLARLGRLGRRAAFERLADRLFVDLG